jgi:trigger factor
MMAYTIETVNSCTKKLTFSFDQLDLSKQIKTAVKEKQKSSSLKGFRKGKAPMSVVEQLFGPQIETEALNKFVQDEFYEAVQKEELKVVGYPSFENMNYEAGKSVSFDAKVEIFPEFKLKKMDDYSFSKEKVELVEDEVQELTKSKLESKTEMVEVEDSTRTLENGLFAVMNFQGTTEDGEKPENMKGEEFLLEIGSNQFIPGFEEGMIGMKSGDKKTLETTFPDSYHVEELKNAKVIFDVELLEIKEKRFPELTDDLAKELGFESVVDMDKKHRTTLESQKNRASQEKLQQEILEKIVEDNKFDVPVALLAQQQDHLKKDLENNLKSQGFNEQMMEEYFSKWADDMTAKAEFQVRSGLILESLAKEYGIETSDSDLEEKITETAAQSGLEPDKIREYYTSNANMKNNMMYAIKEEKTFKKLIENLKVS